MKITEVKPNIYFILFDSAYEAGMTMLRFQEFYESAYPSIRNKFFTLEEYMDTYSKEHGDFTYCSDWSGYNLPDFIIRKFLLKFKGRLRLKEKALINLIQSALKSKNKFYIIAGSNKKDVFMHELAHALFYIDKAYASEIKKALVRLPSELFMRIGEKLTQLGYVDNVIIDELQAYGVEIGKDLKNPIPNLRLNLRDMSLFKPIYNIFEQYSNLE